MVVTSILARTPAAASNIGGPRSLVDSTAALQPSASRTPTTQVMHSAQAGFTLIELMIVMVIIGLLAAIAIPSYTNNVRNGKEAVLREDLHTMREAIDAYTVDKQKAPQSMDDLVQAGYLKVMPVDPFTHRSDTWMGVQSDTLSSVDQTQSGIDDVHSGAQGTSSEGTSYNTW